MRQFIILLTCLVLGTAGPAVAQPVSRVPDTASPGPVSTPRIEAELVPMSAWAAPGSTAVVAVRQVIQPGWHTYWRNPGDSGGATTLDWRLPAGVEAGAIVWPLPRQQRLQGLMNYGYSGEVYLPVPVQIPPTARAGTSVPLTVQALFLVCSAEMCVPDELTLRLDLPVRDGAAPLDRRHGEAIRRVLETAPRPAGIRAHATLDGGVLTLTASGGPLAGVDPGPVYFFPFRSDLISHPAAQTGERGPQGLTLRLQPDTDLMATGLAGPVEGVLSTGVGAFEIVAEPGPPLAGTGGGAVLRSGEVDMVAGPGGLAVFARAVLFALIGGVILNLMPCVFPILAMKAAALTASAHAPQHARRDGLAFLAGVLVTFLILAGMMLVLRAAGDAVGWGFQLQSPGVIAALALLMLAVGFNLSGVFQIGAGLQGAGSGPLARLSGGLGAFFTGVLAVVVAAPCTAPFMAVALGAALLMPWPMTLAVFLALGLGLALPYVAVSLSPGLLARLPRPGPWMERLKSLLAFPMYATALWLVWVFARQTGGEALALLFAAGLLLAFSLWLFGIVQGARAAGARGLIPAVAAGLGLVAAVVLTVMAVAAPREPVAADTGSARAGMPWSEAAVAATRADGRPVLVNFTADWCVTCKINERAALDSPRVIAALDRANAVYLVGDWTRRDDAITAELQRHGRSGVPLYLVYVPGRAEPRVLPQLLTEGVILDALKGVE
ncbi:thioredoxin family protein [uncultured Brevundimonas sp.]|uniref:protein-disulfide reductase DsbD family protein n=1 Tax=uncultured Brevundimonas sp. TaxID=213418 RepID=UPI0030EBD5E9